MADPAVALSLLQKQLAQALWQADAHEPRYNLSLPIEPFATRSARWRTALRAALANSPASLVTDARAPCAGGDVASLGAAFPSARSLTLISREPIGSVDALLSLSPAEAQRLAASVATIFRTSRGGAFQLGHLVRPLCAQYGILPLLLAGARVAGLVASGSVRRVDVGGLEAIELRLSVEDSTLSAAAGGGLHSAADPRRERSRRRTRRGVLLRYVRADLSSPSNRSALRALDRPVPAPEPARSRLGWWARSQEPVVGYLLKGDESAFASEGASRSVLQPAAVVLQETQAGVPWPRLRAWATHVAPLGSHAPDAPPASDAATLGLSPIELEAWRRAQQDRLRTLWRAAREGGVGAARWRSLRGVRFGYCRFEAALGEEARAFVRATGEAPVAAENDAEERGAPPLRRAARVAVRRGAGRAAEPLLQRGGGGARARAVSALGVRSGPVIGAYLE